MKFIQKLVQYFDMSSATTRVGFIKFGRRVESVFDINLYNKTQDLIDIFENERQIKGRGRINRAIKYMRTRSFRRSVLRLDMNTPHVGLVITGSKSDDREQTLKESQFATRAGITMYAVGIGPEVTTEELESIVDSQRFFDHFFHTNHYNDTDRILHDLALRICRGKYLFVIVFSRKPFSIFLLYALLLFFFLLFFFLLFFFFSRYDSFFTLVLTGSFSLKSEWDSSKFFSRS